VTGTTNQTVVVIGFGLEQKYVDQMKAAYPEVVFRLSRSKSELMEMLEDADVFFGWPTDTAIAAGRNLRWIHLLGAGADGFDPQPVAQRGILLTNSRGVGAPNIAEHVLAMMFSFSRALHVLARAQRDQVWSKGHQMPLFELSGQTIGIIGLGAIGQALASKAGALGMRVLGARHSAEPVPGVERVYTSAELPQLAGQVDHLVACLPGTRESAGLIDQKVFSAMKPGSYFYNVGRGSTIVTDDLLQALDRGVIAGAGLDVVDPEPLPPGHPLWHQPNVIMTSHTAGNTEQYWDRGAALFENNLRRYRAGEPLLNQVDPRKGY
jgi:D-2-hydroxyacid dehydrogenase (NADP+)